MALVSIFEAGKPKPEQPSAENAAVPAEKPTDEQAPTKEAFVKPSEADGDAVIGGEPFLL